MIWEKMSLGELIKSFGGKIQTGPFGSQLHQHDYKSEGIPVVMPKDIINDRIETGSIAKINEADVDRLSKHKLTEGDLIVPRRGDIDKRAFCKPENEGWLCGTGCLKIRMNDSIIEPKYLYYYFTLPFVVQGIINKAIGSTMLNLSGGILATIEIIYPPLSIQRKIATILSAYDDLIENNMKRIKLLEEAAEIIYKSEFDFFKPSNEINKLPNGWTVKRADEIFRINIGKTPPREQAEWFNDKDSGIKWVSIKDINNSSVFILNTSETITEAAVDKFNMNIAKIDTVILSFKLTVGKIAITTEEMITNEAIAHFNIDDETKMNSEFIYFYLKNFPYDFLGNTSAIGTAINSKIVKAMPILLPFECVIDDFGKRVRPYFQQIKNLLKQNTQLRTARDILLPRLMNGEIAV